MALDDSALSHSEAPHAREEVLNLFNPVKPTLSVPEHARHAPLEQAPATLEAGRVGQEPDENAVHITPLTVAHSQRPSR